MLSISYFTLSFALTLWFSRFLLRYLDPTSFLDHPNKRKIHDTPTPRFGGMAFSIIIIVLGWFLVNTSGTYTWYFLGAMGMFILGAIDDYYTLSWRYKLPIQLFIGALIVIQFFPHIDTVIFFGKTLPLSQLALMIIFVFWFIGISNSINLIDGLDGLAGGFMLLVSFAAAIMGFIAGNIGFMYINILFIAALLAFLHFNQRPAKFFMGDSGSLLLGYHLAVLPLLFITQDSGFGSRIDMTSFLLLSSYLITDTVRIFFMRIKRGKHPLEPDQGHLHYQLYNYGTSHNGTLMTIFILCGIGCILSILPTTSFFYNDVVMGFYLIVLGVGSFSQSYTKKFVKLITQIGKLGKNRIIKQNSIISNFKIKYLVFLIGIYFVSVLIIFKSQLSSLPSFPIILIIGTIIALFVLQEAFSSYHSDTAILVSFGILHIYFMTLGFVGSLPVLFSPIFLHGFSC